jgi:hypothetical protein
MKYHFQMICLIGLNFMFDLKEDGEKIIKKIIEKKEFIFYSILSVFVLFFSIILVIAKIVVDNTKLNCNGNGRLYIDQQDACLCVQCYFGERCQNYNENCTIDVSLGDPLLFQEFWDLNNQEITIKDNYRIGYQSDNTKLQVNLLIKIILGINYKITSDISKY